MRAAHGPWLTEDLEESSAETRVRLAYCKWLKQPRKRQPSPARSGTSFSSSVETRERHG